MAKQNGLECFVCGGKSKLGFKDARLFDGRIILKNQPFHKCVDCGHGFVTSEEIREAEKLLKGKKCV